MKLLVALLTVVAAQTCSQKAKPQEASEGSCLLAKKKVMGKVSLIEEESLTAFEQLSLQQRDWRKRHQSVVKAMDDGKTLLDKFIAAQTTSSDHCSSRLMESKRILDGILKDAKTLNAQITSREEVLETETENLKITKLSIEAVTTEYTKTITVCKEETEEAISDLKTYSKELEELDQIANPSIRADIAHSVTIKTHTAESSSLSLAQAEVRLSKEMCEAFLDFTQRHSHYKLVDDPSKRNCDQQREELQKAFEKAYKEIRILKEDAKERSVDRICYTTAETKKTAELVPLVSQRDIAIEKIEVASQAIAALEPVLNLVKSKAEKLRTHISETLTPECTEAGEASKVLVRVRELIISLEECPGRNDFKLKIPAKEEAPEFEPEEETGIETVTKEEEAPENEPEKPTGIEKDIPDEAPAEEKPTEEATEEEPAAPAEEAPAEVPAPTPAEEPTEEPAEEKPAEETAEEVPEDDKPPAGAEEVPEDDKPPAGAEEVPEDDKPPAGAEESAESNNNNNNDNNNNDNSNNTNNEGDD